MDLRAGTLQDATLLFEWVADPDTRAASLHTAPIDWATHVAWFDHLLADDDRVMWIGEVDGEPVGAIRFDIADGRANVSIQVAPQHRGRGLGSTLMSLGTQLMAQRGLPIDAAIKVGNAASIAACLHSGYRRRPDDGSGLVHLVYEPGLQPPAAS